MYQVAQLDKSNEASSSPAVTPEMPASGPSSSRAEAADSTSTADKQTAATPSSSSPIDLSTKKSVELESNTESKPASLTATTSQGKV